MRSYHIIKKVMQASKVMQFSLLMKNLGEGENPCLIFRHTVTSSQQAGILGTVPLGDFVT